jgi:hypothetical protein
MTTDELKKEAEEYTEKKHCNKCGTKHCEKKCVLVKDDYETFLDVAEPREKYIAELEQQIEKMKCCANCKHQCSFLFQDEIDCANNGLPKWEIKEK